ncbi:RNA 2',3'-cyclic phosphodiesterase [Pseudomarimonas arenosa]|uniref:RNA 2',3'-cyclic phosphodiesterase n=1 Tax=Pseudomarimonas arenosa TaxID=2774145 RepID=A0AAW3ZN47_9GAMM|nr:RNA 2',3'-cyclic phosphodiesterase [Pseudomarimonas arenosa]MBD8526599.1 RNA 2',3'-cyclic phosphodiesterase [Pseudomarimonas arenosa]
MSDAPALLSRAFLAALPTLAGRSALLDLQDCLQASLVDIDQGWTLADDLHLTLRFLGDLSPAQAESWCDFVTQLTLPPSFDLCFERLDFWPPRAPGLAVARLVGIPDLSDLALRCEQQARACGLHAETRSYVPHITLLRSKRRLSRLPALKPQPFSLGFERVALMMRASPAQASARYAVHASWPLTGAAGGLIEPAN